MGVFLDNAIPAGTALAPPLNFTTLVLPGYTTASSDYVILYPSLRQPFFVGNGLTSGGIQQRVIVPAGATRLFLGIMDGGGWYNNWGSFSAEIVPEPVTLGMLALAGLMLMRRKQ